LVLQLKKETGFAVGTGRAISEPEPVLQVEQVSVLQLKQVSVLQLRKVSVLQFGQVSVLQSEHAGFAVGALLLVPEPVCSWKRSRFCS
jgi:hypothetical protein